MVDTAKELKALLETQEKELGSHHVKVANTLAALADLMVHQGKLLEAEPLYWRVVEIRHKICGQSNLDVAATLHDLSALYQQQGNEAEAERLLRWSCDIRKKLCGPGSDEYQGTLEQLRRLIGDVELDTDGDLQPPSSVPQPRADFSWDEYFERGVELQEKEELLASEHLFSCMLAFAQHFAPLTINHARALDHVARTYLFQGRFAESRKHFEQALAIFENTAGTGDVDTVECLEGTADAHASLDEPEQARFLYTWALAVAQKENFQEPAERISCKLEALPFVSKNKGVDDQLVDKVMTAAAEPQPPTPARPNKKTGTVVKPGAATAEPAGTGGGGLNALLQDLGPAPKKKTVTVVKPQFNQPGAPAASTAASNPLVDAKPSGGVDSAPAASIAPDKVVAASVGEAVSQTAAPRKKTTTSVLKPIAQSVVNPPASATQSARESTAEVAAGGLDALLRDIAPRRKKTTASILKPVFSRSADPTGEPVLQGTVEAVVPPNPVPVEVVAETEKTQAYSEPQVYQFAEPLPLPPTDEEEELQAAPKKKTSGMQKPGKKTGSVQKNVTPVTDLSEVRTERAVSPPSGLRGGDISPRNRGPIRPGIGGEPDQPLDSKPVLRIGKGNLDDSARKPIRPWQRPDRPPLEELLLGKSGSGAAPASPDSGASSPNEQTPQPPGDHPGRQSQTLRPKPDARSTAPEPDPGVFVPEEPPANPMITTMMWEKNMAQAEKQFMLKRYAEAERLYLLALEKAETFGEDDPRLWQTQTQLARVYEADRKFVRAGHLYRSVLQAVEKKNGSQHKDVLMYLERLGELYTIQDRWDEAEGCYQQMLKVFSKAGNHGAASDIMGKLGIVQRRRSQR